MTSLERRLVPWLGFVSALLGDPLDGMPHEAIFDQLLTTFPASGVSYNWSQPDGRLGVVTYPRSYVEQYPQVFSSWQRGELSGQHPLETWHATTGDIRPTTVARVPTSLASRRDGGTIMQVLREMQMEQQLSITYRLGPGLVRAYVLGRSGSDFTDDDLMVAREVQRLLIGLDRQVALIGHLTQRPGTRYVEAGLTAREFAVLGLVAAGHSTQTIARRLQCSPRTVHKHLEHVYRKLGVRDRVNAIRTAGLWGLCDGSSAPEARPELGSGGVAVAQPGQSEGA